MPKYSTDWFTGKDQTFSKLLSQFKFREYITGMEIGVYEGMCSNWLLDNILNGKGSRLIAVDVFGDANEMGVMGIQTGLDLYKSNVLENPDHKDKIEIYQGASQVVLRSFPCLESLDFVYVDGSHEQGDVLEDMVLVWRLLKQGGIMICDDYPWSMWVEKENKMHLPCIGMHAFMMAFEGQFEVLSQGSLLVLKKK